MAPHSAESLGEHSARVTVRSLSDSEVLVIAPDPEANTIPWSSLADGGKARWSEGCHDGEATGGRGIRSEDDRLAVAWNLDRARAHRCRWQLSRDSRQGRSGKSDADAIARRLDQVLG